MSMKEDIQDVLKEEETMTIMVYLILAAVAACIIFYIGLNIWAVLETIWNFIPKPKSKKEKRKEEHIEKIQQRQRTEAEVKGESFEAQVRDLILFYLPGSKVKQNIIIRNGKFSKEIDLIALTPMGFIVVEAKNYNHCSIQGNVKEKDWECVYNKNKRFHLYNPIFQVVSGVWNIKKHFKSLNLEKAVVFSDNCKLTDEMLREDCVYTFSSFRNRLMTLSELDASKYAIYSDEYIEQISSKLDQIDTVSREEHIKNVNKIKNAK